MILYVGLGRMGLPMAIHAARAGQDVAGWDVAADRRALLAAAGVPLADPAEALPRARAVVLMVGAQADIAAIVSGPGGILEQCAPGCLVLVVSTVSPRFVASLGDMLRAKTLRIVDAPVCRAETGAIAGTLLAFLAGSTADCHEAATLMRPYTSDIEIIGERLGAAQIAKTVNNMILWSCAAANEEGLRLASGWDLDLRALRRALVTSSADNWCLRNWDRIDQMPWSIKDMEIALETAADAGMPIPLGERVSELVRSSALLSHAS